MIRVLVADDQPLVRHAVAEILSAFDDITIVGSVADGREAIAATHDLLPDVVLMDIRMPEVDGITATADIRNAPDTRDSKVVMLTTYDEDENALRAMRAGASGFIGKTAEPDQIVRAVRTAHAGDALLSASATRALIARHFTPRSDPAHATVLTALTARERDILRMIAEGLTNQDIADELVISPHTAKTHVNRIMNKTHIHTRAGLVILAYETRHIVPRTPPAGEPESTTHGENR